MARKSLATFSREVLSQVVYRTASAWWLKVKPSVPSQTLRDGGLVELRGVGKARIRLPYYWAWYIHEGHAEIVARPGSQAIHRNPSSKRVGSRYLRFYPPGVPDPRYPSGPPKTLADIRYHTSDQLKALRGTYIQAKRVRARPGSKFFTNATAQADLRVIIKETARSTLSEAVRRIVPTGRRVVRIRL